MTTGGHLLTARPGRYESRLESRYALPYRDPFVLFSNLAAMTHRLFLQEYAVDAGRSSGVEVAGRVPIQEDDRTTLAEAARQIEAGATQITLTIAPNVLIARAVPELIRVRQLLEDATY